MVLGSGRPEQFAEDRPQSIGPDLVCPNGWMEPVRVHHAVKETAARIGELIVDAQKSHAVAVGQLFEIAVDLVDDRHEVQVVVAGEDGGDDYDRAGRFASDCRDYSLDAFRDVSNDSVLSEVVGACL